MPDPTQQVADAGLVAFGAQGRVGEASFSCQLRPALLNDTRRRFDEAAWNQKWGVTQAALWVLSLEVDASSPASLPLDELWLESKVDGTLQPLVFRELDGDSRKENGPVIVQDPLAVLLSAPRGVLSAGAREWIGVLGPATLVDPALRFGSERIELTQSAWESAKALDELPLLHRPLAPSR